MTTKICPECSCEQLSLLHGEDKKLCTNCGTEIDWPLDPGQKSVFKKNVVGEMPPGKLDYLSGSASAWH